MKISEKHPSNDEMVFTLRKVGLHQYEVVAPGEFRNLTMTYLYRYQAELWLESLLGKSLRSLKSLDRKLMVYHQDVSSGVKPDDRKRALRRVA